MQDDLAAQLILYIVFPSFAIVDFLLGAVAKALGWYEQSLGNIVCSNSVTACAVWDGLKSNSGRMHPREGRSNLSANAHISMRERINWIRVRFAGCFVMDLLTGLFLQRSNEIDS